VIAALELENNTTVLDEIYDQFAAEGSYAAMRRACETFRLMRSRMSTVEWIGFCQHSVATHPVREILCRHLPLTQTFRSRRRQVEQELVAIAREKPHPAVLSVDHLATIRSDRRFDFVYVTDLFDTLDDSTGTKLVGRLLQLLQPAGRLLVANPAPELLEAAYLEACLDVILQCRSEEEMAALTALVPEQQISSQCIYRDEAGGTVFLEIQRAAKSLR
jgi:hypothetical protein